MMPNSYWYTVPTKVFFTYYALLQNVETKCVEHPVTKQNVFSVAVVGPKIPPAGGTVSYHTQATKR